MLLKVSKSGDFDMGKWLTAIMWIMLISVIILLILNLCMILFFFFGLMAFLLAMIIISFVDELIKPLTDLSGVLIGAIVVFLFLVFIIMPITNLLCSVLTFLTPPLIIVIDPTIAYANYFIGVFMIPVAAYSED
jgi:hypothetical protein